MKKSRIEIISCRETKRVRENKADRNVPVIRLNKRAIVEYQTSILQLNNQTYYGVSHANCCANSCNMCRIEGTRDNVRIKIIADIRGREYKRKPESLVAM